jgi:hypothetical protein
MVTEFWEKRGDGYIRTVAPRFEYEQLDLEAGTQRFLVLHPSLSFDKNSYEAPVRCHFEVQELDHAAPFIAIRNGRGYRLLNAAIDIAGSALIVSQALETFLRNFREYDKSIRLWTRYICLSAENSDETQRYWNREFVDSMYERAAGVVDMAEFNAVLLENGIIERYCDAEHVRWPKLWNGIPKSWELPKVYPIRLGRGPLLEEDAPIVDYEYVPLDEVANEIRVLFVPPAQDRSVPLITHLAHCPLNPCYMALSYTWGVESATSEIVVNGQRMMVRPNLEKALRSLRHETKILVIWIDAICINQADISECNRQLRRMATIYGAAVGVVSYLGERVEYCDVALDFLRHVQGPVMKMNSERHWDIGEDQKIGPDQYPRMCAALYKLLTGPYFRRAWVIQEVAFASNPLIACCAQERWDTSLRMLDKATYNLFSMLQNDPVLACQMMQAMPDIHVDLDELSYCRKLFYFRHIISRGADNYYGTCRMRENAPGFLETLVLSRGFQAKIGHDKLFALWNVAGDKDGLEFNMDYSQALPLSFTDFAIAWAKQHGKLDIIAVAEADPESEAFYSVAPSWVPDWTTPARTSAHICKEHIRKFAMRYQDCLDGLLYSADGNMKNDGTAEVFFAFSGRTLQCTGIIIDQISKLFPDPGQLPSKTPFFPPDGDTYWKFHEWKDQITQYYADRKELSIYSDPLRAAVAMFHGDVPSAWNPKPRHADYREDGHKVLQRLFERYICSPSKSRHVEVFSGSYRRAETWDIMRGVLRGRTPGITENGYMGLFPDYVSQETPDTPFLVAILATCSVPVLLQERDDGSYKFCGSCFIQGLMEGEVFEHMGADSPQEFWDALIGSGKLTIT